MAVRIDITEKIWTALDRLGANGYNEPLAICMSRRTQQTIMDSIFVKVTPESIRGEAPPEIYGFELHINDEIPDGEFVLKY